MDPATLVDYAKSLDCIHCGLCLNTCPTYRLTGLESSSPRGRIHLMRAVAEGDLAPDRDYAEEMDFCLLCRNCETVCPSGVHFGSMMETARARLEEHLPRSAPARFARWVGFRRLLPSRAALRATAALGRLAQRTGLLRLLAPLAGSRGRGMLDAPAIPSADERAPLAERTPARGDKRGTVAVLEGCVMPELFGRVNRATALVLSSIGLEVRTARAHVCCGSLHAHNGEHDGPGGAIELARTTIEAFDAIRGDDGAPVPVVINSAGCGAHMKELAQLFDADDPWRARAQAFSQRVVDLTELLVEPDHRAELVQALERAGDTQPAHSPRQDRITWDDPCHLCHGQGVRGQPRELLDLLPGVERVDLPDSELCCGSAGIYSLLRPTDSAAILAPKLDALGTTGARTLVTANPGCQLQWEAGARRAGLDVEVRHLAELLAEAIAP